MMEYITIDGESFAVMDAPSMAEALGLVPESSTSPLVVKASGMLDIVGVAADVPLLDFSRRLEMSWDEAYEAIKQQKRKPCICWSRRKATTTVHKHQ